MTRQRRSFRLLRFSTLLTGLFSLYQVGCLPEGSFQQVIAESIIFTSAVTIQSITSLVFNTLFGIF